MHAEQPGLYLAGLVRPTVVLVLGHGTLVHTVTMDTLHGWLHVNIGTMPKAGRLTARPTVVDDELVPGDTWRADRWLLFTNSLDPLQATRLLRPVPDLRFVRCRTVELQSNRWWCTLTNTGGELLSFVPDDDGGDDHED